ncbi:glycosyltransferase family 4 protein [Bradyrhizobium sp. I1.7.5]|uniref:glycosyltransferase family 4 protein n=1 Tax=Bradyrhizobium sp. I1.7.5 TaxID=3156363 RepID=UPI00339551D8
MKIVILAQYFEESDQPGLPLLSSIAEHFAMSGHEVTVIAGQYIRMGRHKAPRFRKMPSGYSIRRTWSGSDGSANLLSRLLSFFAFSLSSMFTLAWMGKIDVIYASSPPIFPTFSALLWARLTGAKFILEICDLWPESAIALGLIRNKRLIAWTAAIEGFLYRHSDGLVGLTQGISKWVQEQYEIKAPIIVARCAVSPIPPSQRIASRAAIRRERDWNGKCIAIFAGTIGHAQDIETLLAAAAQLFDQSKLLIVVMGDGAYRDLVIARTRELNNLQFFEPESRAETMNTLAASDIGLCTLKNDPLFDGAVPTKFIDYLGAGLPVVAPDLQEIAAIVKTMNAGVLYQAGDAKSLADALRALAGKRSAVVAQSLLPEEFKIEYRNRTIERFVEGVVSEAV